MKTNQDTENKSETQSSEKGFTEDNATTVSVPEVKGDKTQILLVWVVVVLVLMSAIQVFQTQKLLAAVSDGNIKAAATQVQGGGLGVQSQVGGCG